MATERSHLYETYVVHLEGRIKSPLIRLGVNRGLGAVTSCGLKNAATSVVWLDARGLPVASEASYGVAVRRMVAVARQALVVSTDANPLACRALLHRYDRRRTAVYVMVPSPHGGTVGTISSSALIEGIAEAAGVHLRRESDTLIRTDILETSRPAVERPISDLLASEYMPPLLSAYAIILSLLGSRPRVVFDRCVVPHSKGTCHHRTQMEFHVGPSSRLGDILEQAIAQELVINSHHREVDMIIARPRKPRAGFLLAPSSSSETWSRDQLRVTVVSMPHLTDWEIRITASLHDQATIGVDSFFAPTHLADLFLHVLNRLRSHPTAFAWEASSAG